MRAVLLAIILAATPALAQSRKYPPVPADEDREAELHSKVWEQALTPARAPYEQLVREAKALIAERDGDDVDLLAQAVGKLDRATPQLPASPDAYAARGEAYYKLARKTKKLEYWTKCADDLAAADDRLTDGSDRTQLQLWLGVCAARAGRLAFAEQVLAHQAAIASSRRGELYTRLGETRIALGKLDEAIDALTAALQLDEYLTPLGHWLLADAYDRARRTSEATEHVLAATRIDGGLSTIVNPVLPLLGAGESEYLLGLTHPLATPARPEYGLVYFRRFLKLAPNSPWRRRAEEHVRELSSIDLPQYLERVQSSTAIVDLELVRPVLKRAMPQLRACTAKLNGSVFELTITRVGPHNTDPAAKRVHVAPLVDGAVSEHRLDLDNAPVSDVDAASNCLTATAGKLSLPAPKDRDTFYRVKLDVVSP